MLQNNPIPHNGENTLLNTGKTPLTLSVYFTIDEFEWQDISQQMPSFNG
jgi:hypothetical protein